MTKPVNLLTLSKFVSKILLTVAYNPERLWMGLWEEEHIQGAYKQNKQILFEVNYMFMYSSVDWNTCFKILPFDIQL